MKQLYFVVLGAFLASFSQVKASVLIYEGFNGYTAGSLVGQAATNTTGLTGSYQSVAGQLNYTATGLTFGNLVTSGGAATSNASGNAAVGITAGSIATTTGTIYSSYLAQITGGGATGALYMGIGSSATGTSSNRTFDSFTYSSDGSRKVGAAYSSGASVATGTNASTPLVAGTTYLIVARYTNVGTALSAGTPGVATVWILTLDQFNYFSSGGFTDAALDSATIGTEATNVFALATQTITSGTYTLDNTKALQFAVNAPSGEYVLDELRYGTSLNDVLPVTAIPEPKHAVLSLVGGLIMILGIRLKRII